MFLGEHPEYGFPRFHHEHLIVQLDDALRLELLLEVLDLFVETVPLVVSLCGVGRESLQLTEKIASLFLDIFEAFLFTRKQTFVESPDRIMRGLQFGSCLLQEKLNLGLEL